MRNKKIQHALILRDAARAAPGKSVVQASGATGQQDVTQSLIRSLQDQVALERALRSAIQLNWALLWQMASESSPSVLNENSAPGTGDEFPSPSERPGQSTDAGSPSSLVGHGSGGDASSSVGRGRIALHDLSPAKLEVIVRDLFNVMGFAAWTENRFSGDRGFDAVAINEDPVMGGPVLIQVKKIKRSVSIEHIMSLVGAVESERATKGVLVTTSHFTSDAREYAARSGRIQLIDGRSLQSLLLEHLGIEVEL
nr:restriction endonuclease [Streptomyces sp. alain-838]